MVFLTFTHNIIIKAAGHAKKIIIFGENITNVRYADAKIILAEYLLLGVVSRWLERRFENWTGSFTPYYQCISNEIGGKNIKRGGHHTF